MSTFVLFIGGWNSKPSDISLWTNSAALQRKDWKFDGYPWPPAATKSDGASGIAAFNAAKSMPEAIAKIVGPKYDEVFIVGHSSGCAIANKIDEELTAALGTTSNVTVNLVTLDGFAPSVARLNRPFTYVWCAEDGNNITNKLKNYPWLKGIGPRMYRAQNCTNAWSLHFSLVNTVTSDVTVKSDRDVANGYSGCRANLCWIPVRAPIIHGPGYCLPP